MEPSCERRYHPCKKFSRYAKRFHVSSHLASVRKPWEADCVLPACVRNILSISSGICENLACPYDHSHKLGENGELFDPFQTHIDSKPNYLSLQPRLPKQIFDDEGPGHLSSRGYRHDNDHTNIQHIQILPTMDEILSRRPPYMPRKDSTSWNFLPCGVPRLVDTHFRQLRYDSVECVIDSTYYACQLLASFKTLDECKNGQETPKGNYFRAYYDVCFEGLGWNSFKGLEVEISFACPPYLQGWKVCTSDVLERGMLVALVGLDLDDSALSTTFFEILFSKSAEGMRDKGNGARGRVIFSTSVVLLNLIAYGNSSCRKNVSRSAGKRR
jgi:hypothetical protein